MKYDHIAGQSVARLEALSDGIFAFAMTLLVLGLRSPVVATVHSERSLGLALLGLAPQFVMYVMSFLTLGIFWVGQQTQLNYLTRSDRNFTWIHILFLMAVAILPFSTKLLAEFSHYRVALLAYWLNFVFVGVVLYASWGYAVRRKLLRADMPSDVPRSICRRIQIAQSLYAVGAALSLINTYWSIGFIVLLQLYYAISPATWRKRHHERSHSTSDGSIAQPSDSA